MAVATAHIGVDFDNTLVCYDELLHRLAVARRLIDQRVPRSKAAVRDAVRAVPDGERLWQELQATAYGPAINDAALPDGVADFFRRCRQHGVEVSIVSHKTDLARRDSTATNLRTAALHWMRANGFFEDPFGLSEHDVHFEPTAAGKIARIRQLACTHFVDDLPETFGAESFPDTVEKLLYAPAPQAPRPSQVRAFRSWKEIGDYLVPSGN
jgi:hypothetical protein